MIPHSNYFSRLFTLVHNPPRYVYFFVHFFTLFEFCLVLVSEGAIFEAKLSAFEKVYDPENIEDSGENDDEEGEEDGNEVVEVEPSELKPNPQIARQQPTDHQPHQHRYHKHYFRFFIKHLAPFLLYLTFDPISDFFPAYWEVVVRPDAHIELPTPRLIELI